MDTELQAAIDLLTANGYTVNPPVTADDDDGGDDGGVPPQKPQGPHGN